MPRFLEVHVACLKRTMLARALNGFMFTPQDVQAIVQETGLNQTQVQVWAEHFRMRYAGEKERLDYLGPDKSLSKTKGGDLFSIKYMEAVFNKEAESGEFFVEFVEPVLENKLVECFESHGAGQVTAITFANDGGDSAANALMRILQAQEKHGAHTRGMRSKALQKSLTDIQNKSQPVSQQEFDEKTAAAIQFSLDHIESGVQSQAVKLEDIEQGVQSQAAKLDGIEQGVCHVIPDYQNEIAKLKDALAKKTAACDTIEGKLAYKTRLVNQQGKYIDKLDDEQKLLLQQNQALVRDNMLMKEQLELCQYLKQTLERSQHLADILSSTLADERAAKRCRE